MAERDAELQIGHDHRVEVGPQRVVASMVDEEVLPGIQRRLEVDARQVERAVIDVDRQLERGDREPVEREQHDEGPEAEQDVGHDRPGAAGSMRSARITRAVALYAAGPCPPGEG